MKTGVKACLLIESDQQKSTEKVTAASGAHGYNIVVNSGESEKPATLNDIILW